MPAQTTSGKRAIFTVRIRRTDEPPLSFKFHAAYWTLHTIYVAAGTTVLQKLEDRAFDTPVNPTLLVLNSSVEGLIWWKRTDPGVAGVPITPKKKLRPFEVTQDVFWVALQKPSIEIQNPTSEDAKVSVFYARS